jgi:hypothetical protein
MAFGKAQGRVNHSLCALSVSYPPYCSLCTVCFAVYRGFAM